MRYIPFVSILPYAYPAWKYKSFRSTNILINGIIFHGYLYNNYNMLLYDTFLNIIFISYTFYHHTKIIKIGVPFTFLSALNIMLWKYGYYYKNRFVSDIFHSMFAHIPGILLLTSHLRRKSITNDN